MATGPRSLPGWSTACGGCYHALEVAGRAAREEDLGDGVWAGLEVRTGTVEVLEWGPLHADSGQVAEPDDFEGLDDGCAEEDGAWVELADDGVARTFVGLGPGGRWVLEPAPTTTLLPARLLVYDGADVLDDYRAVPGGEADDAGLAPPGGLISPSGPTPSPRAKLERARVEVPLLKAS